MTKEKPLSQEELDEIMITLSDLSNHRVKELTRQLQSQLATEFHVPQGVACPLIAFALLGSATAALAELQGELNTAQTLEDVAGGASKGRSAPSHGELRWH